MAEMLKFEIFNSLNNLLIDFEELIDYYHESIQELLEIDFFEINISEIGKIPCKISLVKQYNPQSDFNHHWKSPALLFTIETAKIQVEATTYDGEKETTTQSVDFFISLVIEDFKIQLSNFLLFLQIAKPGALKFRSGDLLINNQYYGSFEPISSIHQESYKEINKLGWPKYRNLKYRDVINWYNRFNLSFQKIANTKTEIALNAFSYLFEYRTDISLYLFWSLIGIESLYCSGGKGKAEQIFENTQIVLGPITNFKKKVKSMYNFRSRLIHGELFIPSSISQRDSMKEIEKYDVELYDATILSVAILTATLQELVYLNRDNLSFKTLLV